MVTNIFYKLGDFGGMPLNYINGYGRDIMVVTDVTASVQEI